MPLIRRSLMMCNQWSCTFNYYTPASVNWLLYLLLR